LVHNFISMKIQQKLTLQFTGAIVIFLSKRLIERDFYRTLQDRTIITAHFFLEADEVSKSRLEEYRRRYLQALPQETVYIYDSARNRVYASTADSYELSNAAFQAIVRNTRHSFREGGRQYAGIYYEDNQGDFVILVSAVDEQGKRKLDNLIFVLGLTFLFSLILTYVSGRTFSRQALAPIKGIIRQVSTVNASNLFARVNEGKNEDEIRELARTFNQMLDRLQTAFNVQKTFVTNASHELRTPITGISTEIELALLQKQSAAEYRETLVSVQEEIDHLAALIESILNLAKASVDASAVTFTEKRMDEMVISAREGLARTFPDRQIRLQFTGITREDELMVRANEQLMIAAIRNILENALKFSAPDRKVTIDLRRTGDQVQLEVCDQGIGMSAQDLQNAFITFFRANHTRAVAGHGIGLSITRKIIELHRGEIQLFSELNKGTRVLVSLPVAGPLATDKNASVPAEFTKEFLPRR
jgi:signal transduction histidine kinase